MNKLLLTITTLMTITSVALADRATENLKVSGATQISAETAARIARDQATTRATREAGELSKLIRSSVAIQYDCKGDSQNKGLLGNFIFEADEYWNPLGRDRTNSLDGMNGAFLIFGSLTSSVAANPNATEIGKKALAYLPASINGFKASHDDGKEQYQLTLPQEVPTRVLKNAQQIPAGEKRVATTAYPIDEKDYKYVTDPTTGQTEVAYEWTSENEQIGIMKHSVNGQALPDQKCTVITHVCQGIVCGERVALHNYYRGFKLLRLSDLNK